MFWVEQARDCTTAHLQTGTFGPGRAHCASPFEWASPFEVDDGRLLWFHLMNKPTSCTTLPGATLFCSHRGRLPPALLDVTMVHSVVAPWLMPRSMLA